MKKISDFYPADTNTVQTVNRDDKADFYDLIKAFKMLTNDNESINLFSVSNPNRNPYFNVVELKPDGYCKLVKNSKVKSRQQAPIVFDMNASFYFYKARFSSASYSASASYFY